MKLWTSSRLQVSLCRALAALLLLAAMAPATGSRALFAQEPPPSLIAYAYNLQHREASEALKLVLPMLSHRGAVELQPGGNALVVRDTEAVLKLIRPRLLEFDHPFKPLRIRVQLLRAEPGGSDSGPAPELPPGVLSRLRELLKYENYSLLAGSELQLENGMAVVHDIGERYRMDFRLKQLLAEDQASLDGFRLSVGGNGEFKPLIHANLNLDLDKPMVLGLAPTEASDTALMLVIECLSDGVTEAAVR